MYNRIVATIRKIPRGKVSTYGAVARAAGYPGAARQVVRVLRTSFGLPWQRVHKLPNDARRLTFRPEGKTGDPQMSRMLTLSLEEIPGDPHKGRKLALRPEEKDGRTSRP